MTDPEPPPATQSSKLTRPLVYLGAVVVIALILLMAIPSCITEGTLVETPDGPRAIETLSPGDAVWSLTPSGRRVVGRVRGADSAWRWYTFHVQLADGCAVRATSSHPLAVPAGWARVEAVEIGGSVRCVHGWTTVASKEVKRELVRVWDLEVDPNPNFFAGGVLVHNKSSVRLSNERSASVALRTVATAEADFQSNDRDGNKKNDFWVGDVAGLRTLKVEGQELQLIEISVAQADAFPLGPSGVRTSKSGYWYATIPKAPDGKPYAQTVDGKTDYRNPAAFAACAWPAEYGSAGKLTFIVNEDKAAFKKDLGKGERVQQWPADPKAEGWSPLD